MQLTTLTFNLVYILYFIGIIVTIHSLTKTSRSRIDCIITWLLICFFMVIASMFFFSIDRKVFPSIEIWHDTFLFTNLIPFMGVKHLFPNNSKMLNIFYYFMTNNVFIIMLLISRTIGACIESLFHVTPDASTFILFAFLVFMFIKYNYTNLRYKIPNAIKSLHGNVSILALFSLISFFSIHFLVDVWGKWQEMNYHLFLEHFAAIIMPTCGFLFLFSSIKNLAEKEKYEKDTYIDALTQIGNRRKLMVDVFNIEDEDFNREHYYLVYMDLDYFKSINDNFGHDVGDWYLRRFVEMMKVYFGEHVVYRMSGDEFIALIKDVPQQSDVIKENVETYFSKGFPDQKSPAFLGVSVGICEMSQVHQIQDSIKEADQRMYENKEKHHAIYQLNR